MAYYYKMRKNKGTVLFDYIVIILGMSYGISILSQLFYVPGLGMVVPLCSFCVIAHIIRFGLRFPVLKKIINTPLFLLFFSIILLDFIQALFNVNSGGNIANSSARIIYHLFYFSYIYNVFIGGGFNYLIKPYVGYSLYNIVVIVLMSFLIFIGIPWQQNQLGTNVQLLLEDMNDGEGAVYYFPYFVSIVADYHQYSIFPSLPGVTGLSHEPNVIMWIVTPALFMFFAYKNRPSVKWFYIISFVFLLLETFSTTAVLCVVAVFAVHIFWLSIKKRTFYFIIPILIAVMIIPFFFEDEIQLIREIVTLKTSLDSSMSGSSDYGRKMFNYLFSFDRVFGYGNLPRSTGDVWEPVLESDGAGILTCIMDVSLYITLLYRSLKMTLSKNTGSHFIGLGFMYLLLHWLKHNYLIFGYPFLSYFIIMVFFASQKKILLVKNANDVVHIIRKTVQSMKFNMV